MDPIWSFAQRNNNYEQGLIYDASYWFYQHRCTVPIRPESSLSDKFYASPELYQFYVGLKKKFILPEESLGEKLIYDRAHPLGAVSRLVKGDVDARVLKLIFGADFKIVVSKQSFLETVLDRLKETPESNIAFVVDGLLTEIDCHTLYLLSLNFHRITLLQPAISNVRYCVCIGFHRQTTVEQVKLLQDSLSKTRPTSIFASITPVFSDWLINLNNTYLGINTEILIHLLESQKNFNLQGLGYWPGMSYNIRRVVNLLKGKQFEPRVIKVDEMQTFDANEIANRHIRLSMHLWNGAQFANSGIHREVNFISDLHRQYDEKKTNVSGDHWGQRKLLLTELQFLTEHVVPGKKTVAFYLGAAPFDHGPFLLDQFPDVNFILIDPRGDQFNPNLRKYLILNRVLILPRMFDLELGQELLQVMGFGEDESVGGKKLPQQTLTHLERNALKQMTKNVKNFMFISDIRSDIGKLGHDEREETIDQNMNDQLIYFRLLNQVKKDDSYSMHASVKFRISYNFTNPTVKYPKGKLMTQPWAKLNSTELRLWFSLPNQEDVSEFMTDYDKRSIEEIMAYHNLDLRQQRYGETGVEGYDECHDCHYEVEIIKNYIQKFAADKDENVMIDDLWLAITDVMNGMELFQHVQKTFNPKIRPAYTETGALRFNPLHEYTRSTIFRVIETKFINTFSTEKVTDEVMRDIFKQFMVYLATTRLIPMTTEDGVDSSDMLVINRKQVKLNPEALSPEEALLSIFAQNKIEWSLEDIRKNLQKINYVKEYSQLVSMKSDQTSFDINVIFKKKNVQFGFTSKTYTGKPIELKTITVDKNSLVHLLSEKERMADLDADKLLNTPAFCERAYCMLLRYRSIRYKELFYVPKLEISEYKPDLICGLTFLSPNTSSIAETYADYDGFLTHQAGLFHSTRKITQGKIFVYVPNIRPLILSYIKRCKVVLIESPETQIRIIVSKEYEADLLQEGMRTVEIGLVSKVYDVSRAKEVVLEAPLSIYDLSL